MSLKYSSLALHDGLVRLSGERQCEGEVEVFIHQVWRRVLLDSWSLTESSVVCRQLGCGSVLNFYGSSSSSPEHSHECVTGFQCSGSEAHLGNCSSPQTLNCSSTQQLSITCLARLKSARNWLDEIKCRPHDSNLWHCPSLPWGQNDCNKDEVAKITCSKEKNLESRQSHQTCFISPSPQQKQCSNLSVSTTSATTTSASTTVSLPVRSTSVTPPQTPPFPPVLVIVLVVVLLLLLVPLLILIQQNRVMRRALSKRRHRMTSEAVYEEIQHRHNHFTQRGSLISEELHSGYEDADELLSAEEFKTAYYDDVTSDSGLKEEMVKEITPGYYDDVITDGLKPDRETEDTPESYDDVMTSGQNSDIKKVNTPENYDDVIITQGVTEGVQEEYDDVTSVSEDVRNLLEFKEIRLTKGCKGNVEVFYNGSWGNVCYNQMDRDTASLICQELNCGRSASEPTNSEGLKPHNWLDNLKCRRHDSTIWQCPSSSWGQNDCGNEVAKITCSEFKEIRLTKGCKGNVEVFYNGSWGNVCYNQMDRDTASLICQELNCGRTGSEPSSSEGLKPHNWLDKLKCRRHDSTIWQCPSSSWGQNDCGNDVANITCSDLSVSTTPATTTSASPSVSPLVHSTSVTPPQTPSTVSPQSSVPPELVIVLVVVLLLLLVPLLILIQQNRVMRRALSKRRHRMTSEAVYEEIQHRHNHFTQRGSLISEELHSGYEDADELLSAEEFKTAYYDDVTNGSGLKEEMVKEITPGYYDDVITDGLKPDRETVNTPENYDDVIINKLSSQGVTEGVQEEYDDVTSVSEDVRNLLGASFFSVFEGADEKLVLTESNRRCDKQKKMEGCVTLILLSSMITITTSDSSLALHDGLVRLSGERQCEGEVEVFIHQVWRRVLLDSWSLTESSVVCRQLGCGSVLNFSGSSSSSPEHSHECVTGFQCSGSEAHLGNCSSPQTLNCSSTQQLSITCLEFKEIRLTEGCEGNVEVFYNGSWGNVCWNQMDTDTASLICQELNCGRSGILSDSAARVESAPNWLDKVKCRPHDSNLWQCPSSTWGQNDCSRDEVAKINCSKEGNQESPRSRLTCFTSPTPHRKQCSNLSVSTTPATATSASPTVRSTSVTPQQTPPTVSPQSSVPPVLVIVLVVVLLLLLVPLLILIQQNRVMRRALSKRRHGMTTEAVYEEIQRRHNHFTQRGSLISEELHSGYEDADELLSAEEFKTAYYDDVTSDSGLKEEMVKEITPGYYDDVITDGLKPDRETVNTPENYDDVIITRPSSQGVTEGVQEEYDDVTSVSEDVRNLLGASFFSVFEEADDKTCADRVKQTV
ncbi:scavenger receptor cysteine-rich type 1 M130-like protein [Labeo rohita]|uniref:Scavenger receptor cysteine-rich type 1 M130-like protein n=1 Tax=Labeo rohita TaxID=84645 RepID=A0A498M7S4_LABRO|nr:scavenger receptor cysteine-rich type 1 M130-like protein [Labeo rohita]